MHIHPSTFDISTVAYVLSSLYPLDLVHVAAVCTISVLLGMTDYSQQCDFIVLPNKFAAVEWLTMLVVHVPDCGY